MKARRYPHQSSIFNKELSEAREKRTKEQKEADAMLKIAKMEVDFKRKRHNLVCQAVQEERRKWEEQRVSWDKQKEEEFEERRRNWAELTEKELVRQQQIFNEEKEKWQGHMQMQENQFKEELNRKVAQEMELMENFKLQQQRQEELMRLQKEEYKKGYQGLQDDQVTWQENQKEKDRLVEELREVLKKNQEEAQEQLGTLKQQMGVQESKITQLTEELELEKIDKQMLLDATKKRIGQLEEQKELLEQNRENNEHVIMEKNALLGIEDSTIPKRRWTGERDKTVCFEDTEVSQGRNTEEIDWDYGSKTITEKWEKGNPMSTYENQPKRTTSTPMYGAMTPLSFEETEIRQRFFCENCFESHEPPVCPCPICEQRGHIVTDCPYRNLPESSQIGSEGDLEYTWKQCPNCLSHHQGVCPC